MGMHWPYKQAQNVPRNVITLPYHDRLKDHGACFGVSGGYERPMWFSKSTIKIKITNIKIYNYQNWYPSAEFETKNARSNAHYLNYLHFQNLK